MKEQGTGEELQTISRRTGLLVDGLACAAFFYPLFWLFSSIVWALPAVIRWAFSGYELAGVRLSLLGARASALPPIEASGASTGFARFPLAVLIPAILVTAALLALAERNNRLLSGFAIALLGQVMLLNATGRLIRFRSGAAELIPASILFAAILGDFGGCFPAGRRRATGGGF